MNCLEQNNARQLVNDVISTHKMLVLSLCSERLCFFKHWQLVDHFRIAVFYYVVFLEAYFF